MQTAIRWTVITVLVYFSALMTPYGANADAIVFGSSDQDPAHLAKIGKNPDQSTKAPRANSHIILSQARYTFVDPHPQTDPRGTQSLTSIRPDSDEFTETATDTSAQLRLDNIKPLYTSPEMPGEGVWATSDSPTDSLGKPIMYKTFYRPSVEFPNAIVFMMLVDMSKASMKYYVGKHEPGASQARSKVESDLQSCMFAVTNALWMQQHSRGAGAIFRGKVIYPMVEGMATLIIYNDGSVDIREWTSEIPLKLVSDARQLSHLIVKNGMIIKTIAKGTRQEDAEIGLGALLGEGGKNRDGRHFWFVAHRSAFGIRNDGNLVFAIGHHIGTKDLAKSLALAGCERAMHADANPDNTVAILYVRDPSGNVIKKLKLSPEQPKHTLNRYEQGYTKDFFAFFGQERPAVTKDEKAIRVDRSAR